MSYNGMFNTEEMDDLDNEIQKQLARPTLVKKLKGQKVRKKADSMSFAAEIEQYWFVYLFLFVSALFTGTLGVYMGLAPYPIDGGTGIYFQTDGMHLFLAFVYLIAFVAVTEGAFALGKRLFFTREENNDTQKYTMLTMMIIAGISILGTGISGGMVVASNISFLSAFVEVPDAAQKWVVVAIPALLTIYTFLISAYHLSSDAAASERITREQIRERELDHRTRRRTIEQIAQERLQEAEIKLYLQMVAEGKLSAAEAQAAMRAGLTLGQLEDKMGRDIDGKNGVGNRLRSPAYAADTPHADPTTGRENHR